jgi:hypothetical protein
MPRVSNDEAGHEQPTETRLEFGRSLFRKRLDAFLDLGAPHAVAVAAVGTFFVWPAAQIFEGRGLGKARPKKQTPSANSHRAPR